MVYKITYNYYCSGKYRDRYIYCKTMEQAAYEIGKIKLTGWESVSISLVNPDE